MSFTIAIINQKGGVGKTSTSYNLSYLFSQLDKKTLFVDLDPSANGSRGLISHYDDIKVQTVTDLMLNRRADPFSYIVPATIHGVEIDNLKVLPSHISLAKLQRQIISYPYKESLLHNHLQKMVNHFDYIFIDCLPTLTDLTINAIYAADFFIIPIKYEKDAFDGIADLFEIIDEIKQEQGFEYRILRNGLDARKKTVSKAIHDKLIPWIEKGVVFDSIIKQDEEIVKAKMNNEPVYTFNKNAVSIDDYKNLIQEIINVQGN